MTTLRDQVRTIAADYGLELSDAECGALLWEHTAWPLVTGAEIERQIPEFLFSPRRVNLAHAPEGAWVRVEMPDGGSLDGPVLRHSTSYVRVGLPSGHADFHRFRGLPEVEIIAMEDRRAGGTSPQRLPGGGS